MILGRTFDHKILDMVEFTVKSYVGMDSFDASIGFGMKPAFIFKGSLFENDIQFMEIKNLFLDAFRGEIFDKLTLQGVEWVICVSVDDESKEIFFRPYSIELKNSGTRVSRSCPIQSKVPRLTSSLTHAC